MEELNLQKESTLNHWMLEFHPMIVHTAFKYVRDKMVAEDIAQEVFLKAFCKMEQYRGEASVSSWLYRITLNACKDHLRSWSHRNLIATETFDHWQQELSTEQIVLSRISDTQLHKTVMQLPVKYRKVILLHFYQHLTTREVAEILGEKHSTIRVRLSRALLKLKQIREQEPA